MHIKFIGKIIDKIKKKNKVEQKHVISSFYGGIYYPNYYLDGEISSEYPNIYNKNGEKMEIIFLRDKNFAHCPNCFYDSNYFIVDRYNFALKTQIYTHRCMLETMGKPDKRIGMLVEPEAITPDDYQLFNRHKGLEKDFDIILTYSEELLDKLDNAKFFNGVSNIWYEEPLNDKAYENKTKNISMVCSDKILTKMHEIRHSFARKLKTENLADIYGKFDGGKWIERKADTLKNYRYQVVIENDISSYYFTEKVMDCFASMTVPIYIGATKIDKFFNIDGIIRLEPSDLDNIETIVKQCCEKDYFERLSAIKDNFNRSLNYINLGDKLYNEFLKS